MPSFYIPEMFSEYFFWTPPVAIPFPNLGGVLVVLVLWWFWDMIRLAFASSVSGKVVIITGASSGIGAETAISYAKRGAILVLAARRKRDLAAVAESCLGAGANSVHVCVTDVSREEDCTVLIQSTVEKFGAIDLLVLNAGVAHNFYCEQVVPRGLNFERYMSVNYYGAVYPTLCALPHLRDSNGGIVVVSSIFGLVPAGRLAFYSASKHALLGFFGALRQELGGGVSVTVACPGAIRTGMTTGGVADASNKVGRAGKNGGVDKGLMSYLMLDPQDCAERIFAAASLKRRTVLVPWW